MNENAFTTRVFAAHRKIRTLTVVLLRAHFLCRVSVRTVCGGLWQTNAYTGKNDMNYIKKKTNLAFYKMYTHFLGCTTTLFRKPCESNLRTSMLESNYPFDLAYSRGGKVHIYPRYCTHTYIVSDDSLILIFKSKILKRSQIAGAMKRRHLCATYFLYLMD